MSRVMPITEALGLEPLKPYVPSAQDLRPMPTETAAHHEECLEAALDDIRRYREPKLVSMHFDREQAMHWAVTHADKHYNALLSIPGYVMPDYLRTRYESTMAID